MAFNIQAARDDGISDADIADHLAEIHKFNIALARNDGVNDAEIADHLAQKSTMLAKVKNVVTPAPAKSVMDDAQPANDNGLAAIRAGIKAGNDGRITTIHDRATDISVARALAPKGGKERDTMAETSTFLKGSGSPRIADQEAVTRKPEQMIADEIESSGRRIAVAKASEREKRAAQQEDDSPIAEMMRDAEKGLVAGTLDLGKAYVGFVDSYTNGAMGRTIDAMEGASGLPKWARPSQWSQAIRDSYSERTKAAIDAKQETAQGYEGAAKARGDGQFEQIRQSAIGGAIGILENPRAMLPMLSENIPGMLAIAKATSMALEKTVLALDAQVAAGTLSRVAANKKLGDLAIKYAALGEGALTAGQVGSEISKENPDATTLERAAGLAAGAVTGAIAFGVAKIPGLGDAEATLATAMMGQRGAGMTGSLPARMAKGIVSEGLLQEFTQSGQEQAFQNLGTRKPWQEGVGQAAVEGLAAGSALGAAAGTTGGSGTGAGDQFADGIAGAEFDPAAMDRSARDAFNPANAQMEQVAPTRQPNSPLTNAVNQGLTPSSVPSGAIDAADIFGATEVEQPPTLTRAAAAAGITPLARDTGAAATSTVQNPAPPIAGENNHGAAIENIPAELDTGAAASGRVDAAGGVSDGVLRYDVGQPAGGLGMPGAPVDTDGAGGVASAPVRGGAVAEQPAAPLPAASAATLPETNAPKRDISADIKPAIERLIKLRKNAGQLRLAPQLDIAVNKAKAAIKSGTGKAADFKKLAKKFKGKDADIHTALLSIANALEPVKPTTKKPQKTSTDLMQRIKQLGGIDGTLALDITGEARAPGGWRFVFKKGGTSLDDLATMLADDGFNIDTSDVDGGVQQLRDMIRDHIGGERNFKAQTQEAQAEAMARDQDLNALAQRADELGINWKNLSAQQLSDAVYEAEDALEMERLDEAENEAEAVALSDSAVDDEIDIPFNIDGTVDNAELNSWLGEDDGQEGVAGTVQETVAEGPEAGAGRDGEAAGQEAGTGQAVLESYTEEEIAAREQAQAAQERAQQAEEAAAKAEQAKKDQAAVDAKKKAHAENPENFNFGESSKDAVKPMGGLFNQPADTQFANNKIFTQSAVDAARARLKKKLGTLNSAIDPELLQDGITLAGAHIEAGARSFAAYSKAMIEDLGDAIKPYLRSLYESVRHYPGLDTDGMTGSADIDAIAAIQEKAEQPAGEVKKPKASTEGTHFAAGQADFNLGKPRVLPSYFTSKTGKNPTDWYRGWDAANLAAPVSEEKGAPESLHSVTNNDTKMQANVYAGENGTFNVAQKDLDSGETVQDFKKFDTLAKAIEYANTISPAKAKSGETFIGKNADGVAIFEDKDGVRYFTSRGIKVQETVSLAPYRQENGAIGYRPDASNRKDEYKSVEELGVSNEQAPQSIASVKTLRPGDKVEFLDGVGGSFHAGDTGIVVTNGKTAIQIEDERGGYAWVNHASFGDGSYASFKIIDNQGAKAQDKHTGGADNARPNLTEGVSGTDQASDSQRGSSGDRGGESLDAGLVEQGEGADSGGRVSGGVRVPGRAGTQHTAESRNGEQAPDADGVVSNVRDNAEPADGLNAGVDHAITDADEIGSGGLTKKFRDNVAAIKILKALDTEGRAATPEERKTLARYVGFGALKAVFDKNSKQWEAQYTELRELLNDEEYESARASVLNAHFTSKPVVDSMFSAVRRMGFTGGRFLEPSAGSGNFFGMMPADIRKASTLHGVELDLLTSKLLKALYPKANIAVATGFQHYQVPAGYFDIAMGNPPFGSEPIIDRERSEYSGFSIHNYFIARMIDKVRDGGIVPVIVSHNFMDAINPKTREWIAKRANLIAAVRLPNTAFKGNAGTEVVTDILFFQKTATPEKNPAWVNASDVVIQAPKGGESATASVNVYFQRNKQNILGKESTAGSMYRANEYTVEPTGDLAKQLAEFVASLPENIYKASERTINELDSADNTIPAGVKQGSYFVTDKGEVKQRGQDIAGAQTSTAWVPKNDTAMARMKGMISLRNLLRTQMRMERDPAQGVKMIEGHRKTLNKAYDEFHKKYGFVNSQVNRAIFMDDTEYALLQAIEFDYDKGVSKAVAERNGMDERAPSAKKADILERRVLFPFVEQMNVSSAQDALLSSLDAKGGVDLEYMERAYNKSQKEIIDELGDMIYQDPTTGDYAMSDEYLSGDVKTKLAEAKKAADEDHAYARNVKALEKIIPADKLPSEIYASLGAGWIPAETFKQFATEITGSTNIDLNYLAATAQWLGNINDGGDVGKMSSDFGTKDLSSFDLLKLTMNGKAPEVKVKTWRDGKEVLVTDPEATEAAREKAGKIKQAWESWVWNDGARAEKLAGMFNEKHNRTVNREYDGEHLVLHGSNPAIVLRKHQKSAVWRGIQDRNLLLDHVVGAGKTIVGIATIMEYKRLGIARKPIVVVPNHLTTQWRSDFAKLYPAANVLAANPDDFSKANRQRMFSKIALGEYDAVIIGHSSLTKIGLDPAIEEEIYKEQIDEVAKAIEEMKTERGDRGIVRDMEKVKANLEAKVEKLRALAGARDKVVTFDELGIDGMFIDEMHEFKNLSFTTQMQRVSGLGNPKGSGKAFDLFAKVRWLTKTYGAKVPLITATGTPISNSLSEMFTMQRFMKYDEMKRDGLHLFDSWARMYGDVESLYEVAPSGVGYRISQRFSKFKNLPSLMAHYRTFADTVTLQDLKDQSKEAGKVFPVPKITSGRPENIVAQRSDAQRDFFGVPTVRRDDSGKVVFAMDYTKAKIEQNKDAKWILSDGSSSSMFDTKEDAELALVEKALTPILDLDPHSLLGQFSNLAQLTRETKGKINALSLTNLASKAGLDMRIINPNAEDFAGSKINKAVDKMMSVYQKWSQDKGAQLVFCDTSIPLSARAAMATKDRRLFVLDEQGMLTHKKGTLHTIEGFEGFPFYLVRTIDRGSPSVSIYDPVTGSRIKGDMANKGEAKSWVADFLSSDANRDKWHEARDSKEPITAEHMAEYRAENDLELADDGSNEVSLEDVEGVSGASQFSVYDDIKAKLVARGVPENQIAFIHDYDTPAKKQALFKSVNRGDVRFLFGSTPKLGAGTNVQERLVGLHHIDAPWRPSDLEQREGRIIRQGNMLYARDPDGFEVFIGRYATEQTYDTRRWQLLEHKASGIEQLRKYSGQIEIEDVAGEAANSADMKAAASGNPLILEETKLRTEVKRLTALQKAHGDGKYAMQRKLNHERNRVETWLPSRIAIIGDAMKAAAANPVPTEKGAIPLVEIEGRKITDREKAEKKIAETVTLVRTGFAKTKDIHYRGVKFTIKTEFGDTLSIDSPAGTMATYGEKDSVSPSGLLTRLANYIDSLEQRKVQVQADLEQAKKDIASIELRMDAPFEDSAALAATQQQHGIVQRKLMNSSQMDAVPMEERAAFAAEIKERKDALEEFGYGKALKEMDSKDEVVNGDDAPLASLAKKADIDSYEVQPNTARNLPIDGATLVELRRAAAGIESAERGITFTVNADGKAIVTGPARVKVPARFQRFANEHGLTLVVQRADSKGGFSNANTAMPLENREAGALYFGEMGADHLDRTGKTRFSNAAKPNATPQTVESVRQATAKLRASWHGFKQVKIVQSVKEIPNELYLRALRAARPIAQDSEGIYDPKTRTVYLIADNLASPERAVWVAIHEVAGHGGIRMLGSPVVDALNFAAKNGFVAKLAQAIAADRGETFDSRTHTDEAIAELAAATITGNVDAIMERYGVKVPMGMRSNLLGMIKRVVDAVRNFIGRVTGKPVEEVSDGEVLGLIRRMKDTVEGAEQGYDTAGVSNGVMASRAHEWKAIDVISARFKESVNKFLSGDIPADGNILLADNTPASLQLFGWKDSPLAIKAKVIDKLVYDHAVTASMFGQMADMMRRPAMMFSDTKNDSIVIIGELREGRPTLIALRPEVSGSRERTLIVTAYEPNTKWEEVTKRLSRGELIYRDTTKKIPDVVRIALNVAQKKYSRGSETPLSTRGASTGGESAAGSSYKVLYQSDLVKLEQEMWGDTPLFSSAPDQSPQEKQIPRILRTAKKGSMEADTSLIDKVVSAPFKLAGWNRIVEPALDRLLDRAGEFVPEKVKAGLVSDYGLGADYIDRKAEMKASEAAQNRKSAGLVEMLAALTRAESRVAYQWMQEKPDTATERALLERLPEESRETLARLKKMISDMGKEAVRLGQMSQEAYQRNNMAYLHRTYAKHVLNNEGAISKMLRARALKIKGNQYKGRGIFDEVRMDAVGAEGVFGRKLQQGQADKSLVGEKLIRFERRDDSTDAMDALPGMTKKPMGKLREVIYWPASTPVPQKFGDWVNSGTFEVRDTKGDKLVVWRDFTPDERERMGELDEVRYAVAQTLHMMTHDIEVGRFFAWTAKTYGKAKPEGRETTASESMLHSFGKDEWVQVPSAVIPGTQTRKYGALAGLYIPGAVWNDIRQTAGTRIEPFGHAHEKVLQFWKKAKTAWSPAVHMNNVMANFVIADWHDLRAIDLAEALSIWANSGKRVAKVKGWVGLDGSEAKRQQYEQIMHRFEDSGALGGMFLSNEALRDEIAKQLESIKAELTGEQEAKNEMTRMAKVMHLVTMAGMVTKKGAEKMEDAYQFEDAIFRLAAFTKAIRYGKSDIEAGRIARHSFLNYDINAPWIQAARHTFLPFISFFYRALPMALNTVKSKPWKVVKLMAFWHLVSMAGYMMSGGDDEDELEREKREKEERALLPKEKQGSVWGVVPKMVRMPWNHDDDAPYFLDIRRWVPVGDVADLEMGAGMLPPWATPGGPLIMLAEMLMANKSFFTEKEIVLDTDTQGEKLEKRLDHVFKGMLPNVPLPNPLNLQTPAGEINPLGLTQGSGQSYAWSGIERSMLKREGSIGEVRNTPAAIANTFGIKVSAYPAQNMEVAKNYEFSKQVREIEATMNKISRNFNNLEEPTTAEQARYERDIDRQRAKLEEVQEGR